MVDVTDQQELEQHISRQISLLNHILDRLPGLFYMLEEDGTFVRVNRNVEDLFDKSARELKGSSAFDFIAPRKLEETKLSIEEAFTEGYSEIETILIDGHGREHHYYVNGSRLNLNRRNYIIGNGIDITDRVEAEQENVILLQEVHHRVKNNLAIISGILSMELQELPADSRNRLTLERSVNRIQAIAKVHELLYQSESYSAIDVDKYVSELVTTVMDTMKGNDNIELQLDIDVVKMNLNEIIPLGMLLNELLTNSLKYAFRDQREGLIILDISKRNQKYDVLYRDNGRGFDRTLFENSETMGFTIVNVLLQQLDAQYEINTNKEFKINFTFEVREKGSHANI